MLGFQPRPILTFEKPIEKPIEIYKNPNRLLNPQPDLSNSPLLDKVLIESNKNA